MAAVQVARAAPSVQSTQPWRWFLDDGSYLGMRLGYPNTTVLLPPTTPRRPVTEIVEESPADR
jgi:hypothetical protein